MSLGVLILSLHIPGCLSLKEKRSRLKPLLARLHREFNLSVAEVDQQDNWQGATIACAMVSNLQGVSHWIETHWLDVDILEDRIELIGFS